jgi:hypothetical protein
MTIFGSKVKKYLVAGKRGAGGYYYLNCVVK